MTAELVAQLAISRFVGVTGSSGSGKSSLVHAGLIPALRAGAIADSDSWPIVTLTPHAAPLLELARSLVERAEGASAEVLAQRLRARPVHLADLVARAVEDRPAGCRFVVVVDQFEEAFTLCRDDVERAAFFDTLVHAASVPDGPGSVVVVLRGDYYGHCSVHPELARSIAASHRLVGPMSPNEIRAAIEEPARRAGLTVESGLVDRAIDDTRGAASVLPLLSTALLETWRRRRDGHLTTDAYVASGGVNGAIARLAESVHDELTAPERDALRSILLRLAELGEDGDDVRRRARHDEVVLSPMHQSVLDVLVSHRLVTVDLDRVEVAHEALLREWPRLRTWLEEDRAGRRLHRGLTADAWAWDEAGRPDDLLYRGVRLESAMEWAGRHTDDLHPVEQAFLDAGSGAWRRQLTASRRTARRFRVLSAALALLLAVAVAAGFVVQDQRNIARDRADAAEASRIGELSALAISGRNLEVARAVGDRGLARRSDERDRCRPAPRRAAVRQRGRGVPVRRIRVRAQRPGRHRDPRLRRGCDAARPSAG